MTANERRLEVGSFLLLVLLIVAVFASGLLTKRRTWGGMEYQNMKFIRQEKGNPTYGAQNTGPGFNLPAGHYDLKFTIETDGAGEVRIVSQNDAPIEPMSFSFSADQDEQIVSFDVLASAKLVEIVVDWKSGTRFKMGETRLYTPYYRDNAFTSAFFAFLIWLLIAMRRRGLLTPERRRAFVLIGIAVLFASAPALREHLSVFHDTRYHSARLRNLADAISMGQFPARLGGFSYNGYGAITSVFYPDILLTPFALLLINGASLQYVMNLLLITGNLLAAFTMYLCGLRIWKDERAALLSSILYTLSVYRVTDGCVRYALGELYAMGFLPIFISGLYEVLWGKQKQWPLLALGASFIFLSHLLSTFLSALLAAALCILSLPQLFRKKRWLSLIKALGLTATLCVCQILPMLSYTRQGIGAGDSMFSTTMESTAIAPAQLFLLGAGNLSKVPNDATISFMPLELGLPLILGVGLLILIGLEEKKQCGPQFSLAFRFALAGGWFVYMTTTLFPWQYISAVTDLFDRIQFAYRYLMFPALLFSLSGGYAFSRIQGDRQGLLVPLFVLASCVIAILPTISAQTRMNTLYEFGTDVSPDIRQFDEYCLPDTSMKVTDSREVIVSEGVTVTELSRKSVSFSMRITAPEGGMAEFPVFAFDGYRAELNGKELSLSRSKGGKLQVLLPLGADGMLRVRFAGSRIWRIADAVSLLTAVTWAGSVFFRLNKARRLRMKA